MLPWRPLPREDVPVTCGAAPLVPRGRTLRVLVWNVQWGAGRGHYFYDGGRTVSVGAERVHGVIDGIAETLDRERADVVLLQEVDRGARRSGYVDMATEILRRTPFPAWTSTPYHRRAYVPYPPHEHLGRMDMHLVVLSRFAIAAAWRHALPLLRESRVRRFFNLRRCVLEARLPIDGGGVLRLYDTHLSAFSRGDGTLEAQVAELLRHVGDAEAARAPWLLAGDLNALPPGDDARRLLDAHEYPEAVTPILPLFERCRSVLPPEAWLRPEYRTYLPPGADVPDRVLDYGFVGGAVHVDDVAVVPVPQWSDHLPLRIDLRVGPAATEPGA